MPITFPLDPTRTITSKQPSHDWAIMISEGNSYRALDAAVVTLAHNAGDVWIAATTVFEIDGLLAYWTDPHDGAEIATVVTGNAEVNDAYIQYGALDPREVNGRLCALKHRAGHQRHYGCRPCDPDMAGSGGNARRHRATRCRHADLPVRARGRAARDATTAPDGKAHL
jgi:hypothetical protein